MIIRNLSCALLIVLCAHDTLTADGLAYTVVIKHSGLMDPVRTFNVLSSGNRLRATLVDAPDGAGVLYDGLLHPRGAPIIALNSRNQTWYELENATPLAATSRYLHHTDDGVVKNIKVRVDPATTSQGKSDYSGEFSYEVHEKITGHKVKVTSTATFTVTTTDKAERTHWLGRILPETGYAAVDAQVMAVEASIEGLPSRIALDVTRQYSGGAPLSDFVRIEVSDIHPTSVDESHFIRPADYRHQKPVVAAPGVQTR